MPKLILRLGPRPAGQPAATKEPKPEPVNTSMFNDDESMRIAPGWTQIERHNDRIGRTMPYASKKIKVAADSEEPNLLWSEGSKESKQVMLSIKEVPTASDPKPLPILTTDMLREVKQPDGSVQCNLRFKQLAFYEFDEGNDPRVATTNSADQNPKQDYTLEIFYPLFKVERVERIDKRDLNTSSDSSAITKIKSNNDWDYGPWSLNNTEAGLWEATHSGVSLIRFGDDHWSHPDFFERAYVTSLGTRYVESLIERKDDLGLFENDGAEYIWRLSPNCQDIQLYEAHMDRKIRSHGQWKDEQKVQGGGQDDLGIAIDDGDKMDIS